MVSALLQSLVAVLLVSVIAFMAIFFLKFGERKLFYLVSFAAGAMLAAAFVDMLPEAAESGANAFGIALLGLVVFFVLERSFWHHHHASHKGRRDVRSLVALVTAGDAIHNFFDGTIIASSFIVSPQLGVAATLAIIMHEIPQELGDAGILLYSGMSRLKAALLNLLSALTAFVGVFAAFWFSGRIEGITALMVAFAAGGFIYIAAGDLLPELRKERDFGSSAVQLCLFVLGIALIWGIKSVFGG